MKRLKRTYALPSEMLSRFERELGSGRRSEVIAALIDEWLKQPDRESQRVAIEEGCSEMANLYLETAKAWPPLDVETTHAFDE